MFPEGTHPTDVPLTTQIAFFEHGPSLTPGTHSAPGVNWHFEQHETPFTFVTNLPCLFFVTPGSHCSPGSTIPFPHLVPGIIGTGELVIDALTFPTVAVIVGGGNEDAPVGFETDAEAPTVWDLVLDAVLVALPPTTLDAATDEPPEDAATDLTVEAEPEREVLTVADPVVEPETVPEPDVVDEPEAELVIEAELLPDPVLVAEMLEEPVEVPEPEAERELVADPLPVPVAEPEAEAVPDPVPDPLPEAEAVFVPDPVPVPVNVAVPVPVPVNVGVGVFVVVAADCASAISAAMRRILRSILFCFFLMVV